MMRVTATEIGLRVLALVVGLAVTLASARRPKRFDRLAWRVLGVVTALAPCLVALGESGGAVASWVEVAILGGLFMAALLGGAITLALGLRGRRVGDHEFCRRCGFDLFGRPPGTRVCGECGAPLDAPRAIVVGERRRRPRLVLVGSFVLLVALGYGATYAPRTYRWAAAVDLSPYKPESWLLRDAQSPSIPVANAAYTEIQRRLMAGRLSEAGVEQLIAVALTNPATTQRPPRPPMNLWVTTAASFTEIAWQQGRVSEATARRVMQAAIAGTLTAAPQASRGRTLRYCLGLGDYRLAREELLAGERYTPAFRLTLGDRVDTLDGRPLPPPTWSTLVGALEWPTRRDLGNAFDLSNVDAPPGPATLRTRLRVTLTLDVPGRPTLVESADLDCSSPTTLVEPAAMACPPILKSPPADDPDAAMGPAAPVVDGHLFADTERQRHLTVQLKNNAGRMLADVTLRPDDGSAPTPLGTHLIDGYATIPLPTTRPMDGTWSIELRPVPERGADLFAPGSVFHLPATLPSTMLRGE